MVLMESLTYGCVPITFESYEAVRDLIRDEHQLVTPFSMKEYETKLSNLMKNEMLRNRLRESGYKIAEEFSLPKIADDWEQLIAKSLSVIEIK